MTTLIKLQPKGLMTLPSRFRSAVGVSEGDMIEISVQRGRIVRTPKLTSDRSQFPSAHDESTPAQRRAIARGIAQCEKEYEQERSFGPFNTHWEFIASLHKESAKLRGTKRKSPAK